MNRISALIATLLLSCISISAQVSTGLPPLGSFSSGPDPINLGNLNIHAEFPVFSKPGRGLDFTYVMGFDSSVWTPVTVNGAKSWQPAGSWGWRAITEAAVGYISSTRYRITCWNYDTMPPRSFFTFQTTNFQYHDWFGVVHYFDNIVGGCPGDTTIDDSISTDASGFTLNTAGAYKITTPFGQIITPPTTPVGSATSTDSNGNQITIAGNVFTDTLGMTALTITGGAPNPQVFTYTTPSGMPASVTLNYSQYTIKTNFQCSGISDYGPTANYLVSSMVYPDGSQYSFTYESTPGSPSYVTGRIQSMTLRTGATIAYTYTGGNNGIMCADGSTAGITRTTSDGTTIYSRSGSGTSWTTTVLDASAPANQTIISFQTAGSTTPNFYETRRSIYQGASTLLRQIDTCYNSTVSPNCSTTAVAVPILEIKTYVTLDNNKQSLKDVFLTNVGTTREVDEYDFGAGGFGALLRKTVTHYPNLGNGVIGKPDTVTVYDGSGNQKTQITLGYDGGTITGTGTVPQHLSVSGARGNLTSIGKWLDTNNTFLTTTFTYDDTGNVLTTTDPGTHVTTFSYLDNFSDGNNTRNTRAYLTQVTLPDTHSPNLAHHVSSIQYEPNTGLPVKGTDENGNFTTVTYDSMLRPLQTTLPDGGQKTVIYQSATQTLVQQKIDASHSTSATTLLDGYGRLSRSWVANAEATPYDQQDFCYDSSGRLSFRSYTYQGSGAGAPKVCSGAGDSFAYDALGRATAITHSDGTRVQASYAGLAQQTTDEGNGSFNVKAIQQMDALGRLAKVCEAYSGNPLLGNGGTPISCDLDLAGSGFVTSYVYDTLDHLTAVFQGSLANRTFAYDSLGRMMSESEPEWTAAPAGSPSTVTYGYNSDGLLASRVRPAPNQADGTALGPKVTTIYAYDELHRLRSKTYSDGVTPATTFNYDETAPFGTAALNTTGMLTSEDVGNAKAAFSYDPVGRITSHWQCTPQFCPSTFKQLTYQYDLLGNILSASNGAGVTFSYAYNTAGRLTGINSSLADSTHPGTLLSNVHYGAFGTLGSTLGNGVAEAFDYKDYGALKSYSSVPYSFTVGFAPNASVSSANDTLNGNWAYGYDQFNHLASSSKNQGQQTFSYDYDRYGNRWHQNAPQGGPAPQYSFDNNNHISGSGVAYDALGNVINDGLGNAYTYDAESRVISVNSGATATYSYDAEGRRVRAPGAEYLYDQNGHAVTTFNLSGVWSYGEIYAGGRHLGTYSGATTNFMHTDWLGSKRVMTDVNGANSQSCTGMPFGDGVSCTGTDWNFNRFTDHMHDSETNLEHTWFRQYSGTQGRFTTPDPYQGSMDLGNPQSLNRYAYVSNDPMNSTDPLGLEDCSWGCMGIWDWQWGGWGASKMHLCSGFSGGPGGEGLAGCEDIWFDDGPGGEPGQKGPAGGGGPHDAKTAPCQLSFSDRAKMFGTGLLNLTIAGVKFGAAAGIEVGTSGIGTGLAIYGVYSGAGNLTTGTIQAIGAFMPNATQWQQAAAVSSSAGSISGLTTLLVTKGDTGAALHASRWEGIFLLGFRGGAMGKPPSPTSALGTAMGVAKEVGPANAKPGCQ